MRAHRCTSYRDNTPSNAAPLPRRRWHFSRRSRLPRRPRCHRRRDASVTRRGNHTISTQSTSATASIHAGLDRRGRIPRPQVRPGRQAHQRELGLQRELREGVRRVGIHRHAGHTRPRRRPREQKQGIVYVLSGSAAAPAASPPSTAAAPRTSCASGKSLETPDSAPRASARRPRT